VGTNITYREASLLVQILFQDSSSWLQAAVNEWKFPASPEWIMLVQNFDAFVAANSKTRPKRTPMPWEYPKVMGKPTISQHEVRKILDAMRPKETDG
jgi:hypothetical protein